MSYYAGSINIHDLVLWFNILIKTLHIELLIKKLVHKYIYCDNNNTRISNEEFNCKFYEPPEMLSYISWPWPKLLKKLEHSNSNLQKREW